MIDVERLGTALEMNGLVMVGPEIDYQHFEPGHHCFVIPGKCVTFAGRVANADDSLEFTAQVGVSEAIGVRDVTHTVLAGILEKKEAWRKRAAELLAALGT